MTPRKLPKKYSIRFGEADDQRIDRARQALSIDGEPVTDSTLFRVLVRRGLDSLEREIAPQKAAA